MYDERQTSLEQEARKADIKKSFEMAFKRQLLIPSKGQLETTTVLSDILSRPLDKKVVINVMGLSGSGKTVITQTLRDPLEGLGVSVVDDEVNVNDYLEQNPQAKCVIHTVQSSAASQQNIEASTDTHNITIEHKGFSIQEIVQNIVPYIKGTKLEDAITIEEDRLNQLIKGDEEPTPEEAKLLKVFNKIAAYSFGSLELAKECLRDYDPSFIENPLLSSLEESSFFRNKSATFLAKNLSGIRELVIEKDIHGFSETLSKFTDLDQQYFRAKSMLYDCGRRLNITELDIKIAEFHRFTEFPSVEGIPYTFKARNSLQIYEKIYEVEHAEKKEREPGINIGVPALRNSDLEIIVRQCGIVIDPTSSFDNDADFGARMMFISKDPSHREHFRKSFLNLVTMDAKNRDPKYYSSFWATMNEYWEPHHKRYSGDGSSMAEIANKLFKEAQDKPALDFHSHEHTLNPYTTIRLGLALETLLQHLGVPYIARYPIPNDKSDYTDYLYNPKKQEMEEVQNPPYLAREIMEPLYRVEELRI